MVIHKCTQEKTISDLQIKQETFMEILKEVKDDVKEIKKYLFEGGLETNYAKKTSVDRLRVIVWSIIGFVFASLGTALMLLLIQ